MLKRPKNFLNSFGAFVFFIGKIHKNTLRAVWRNTTIFREKERKIKAKFMEDKNVKILLKVF